MTDRALTVTKEPPVGRTIDESWGATRTQVRGKVRLALDGVTVEASTDKAARLALASKLWVEVDGPAGVAGLREYHLAYAESKIERYTALRVEYAAMKPGAVVCPGCNSDGSDQTATQAVAIIDDKLTVFRAMAEERQQKTARVR